MQRFIATAALAASYLLAAAPAFAHAHLKTATPAVGSTVSAAPSEIGIDFTEALEPKFSTIEVQDATGKRVDANNVHTAPTDAKHLAVGVPSLAAGTYKVIWHAVSVDTHRTEGTYSFTIKP